MVWNKLYRELREAKQIADGKAYRDVGASDEVLGEYYREYDQILGRACDQFPWEDSPDMDWLIAALEDPDMRWFVKEIVRVKTALPPRLLEPMLRAAVRERDPQNELYVRPCVAELGANEVGRRLLRTFNIGDRAEKAGAARLSYWVFQAGVAVEGDCYNRKRVDDPDLRRRMRLAVLREFVQNDDSWVRQCLTARLDLDPSRYAPEHRHLVAEAIAIRRISKDAERERLHRPDCVRIVRFSTEQSALAALQRRGFIHKTTKHREWFVKKTTDQDGINPTTGSRYDAILALIGRHPYGADVLLSRRLTLLSKVSASEVITRVEDRLSERPCSSRSDITRLE
jgi:hypothetical protein